MTEIYHFKYLLFYLLSKSPSGKSPSGKITFVVCDSSYLLLPFYLGFLFGICVYTTLCFSNICRMFSLVMMMMCMKFLILHIYYWNVVLTYLLSYWRIVPSILLLLISIYIICCMSLLWYSRYSRSSPFSNGMYGCPEYFFIPQLFVRKFATQLAWRRFTKRYTTTDVWHQCVSCRSCSLLCVALLLKLL